VSNWYGWAGYLSDEEIDSYYCNVRQYNAARFMTRDPVRGMGSRAMAFAGRIYIAAYTRAVIMHYTIYKFMTTGKLDTSFFRGPEYHAWKHRGVWQEGWHFHLPWGPGLGKHHLPQEFIDWWKNFMSVYFGR